MKKNKMKQGPTQAGMCSGESVSTRAATGVALRCAVLVSARAAHARAGWANNSDEIIFQCRHIAEKTTQKH